MNYNVQHIIYGKPIVNITQSTCLNWILKYSLSGQGCHNYSLSFSLSRLLRRFYDFVIMNSKSSNTIYGKTVAAIINLINKTVNSIINLSRKLLYNNPLITLSISNNSRVIGSGFNVDTVLQSVIYENNTVLYKQGLINYEL